MDLTAAYRGLRVCDLSAGIAGPHGTMLLAQHGADVIKVEPPEGDWARVLGDGFADHTPSSFTYNLGKRSLALDLKSADGKEVLRRLVASCDVFVESFRPGVVARLGFSFDEVRQLRPDVIYASLSGFGQSGPYSQRGTVDALMQGFSGMMVMNQSADGVPQRQNMTAVDVVSGLYLCQALMAALACRAQTGQGGYLDISLMQAAAAFQASKIMEFHFKQGENPPMYAPAGYLKTADGAVSLSTMRQKHYEALCQALDRADLITDPRFAQKDVRIANRQLLMTELEAISSTCQTADLLRRLHQAGVFVERVQSYGEWLQDEHVRQAQAYSWVDAGAGRPLPLAALPGLPPFDPPAPRAQAPHVGAHTAQILQELGYDEAAVSRLRAGAVVRY